MTICSRLIFLSTFLGPLLAGCETPAEFGRSNAHDPLSSVYSAAAPTDVQAEIYSDAILKISWHDNSSAEKGYLLERNIDGGSFSPVQSLPPNTVSTFDTTTSFGSFSYRVTAVSGTGRDQSGTSNSVFVSHWPPGTPLNRTGATRSAVKLPNGKVFAFYPNASEIYDPATRQWRVAPDADFAASFCVVGLLNGRILVVGLYGFVQTPSFQRPQAEIFDPASMQWTKLGFLSDSLSFSSDLQGAIFPDGKVLICGVLFGQNFRPFQFNRMYDPVTNSFVQIPDMGIKRAGHSLTVLQNGKALVTGGFNWTDSVLTSRTEVFDPAGKTWSFASSSTTIHSNHEALLLNDGRVLILGGNSHYAELYDPVKDQWSILSCPSDRAMGGVLLADGEIMGLFVMGDGTTRTFLESAVASGWSDFGVFPAGWCNLVLLDNGRVLAIDGVTGNTYLFRR